LVDLNDRTHDIVKKYSGGMRRRMEIARGLLHEPKVLFLDEPTIGLDPQTREHIWRYIESLAKRLHMTIILTTHYMEEAEGLCNRIAIIDHGKIAVLDTPANLVASIGGNISVKTHSLDMNDVFLHYTGRAIREEEGDEMGRLRSYTNVRQNNSN
jgi:ABC-2 type transport system ATP-binding protein